ncbi:hypothetical protein [Robiginitalea myxolifaciens]|uniref:hypothetical protein n=1 Tax=Robiginitalea myxolifaciens TaxID=400055 RepID=UPI000AE53A39|nr:hypothetical protein [Robiginitalea myxolifaciens]
MKRIKQHITLLSILLIAGCGALQSQYKIKDGSDLLTLQQVPMEKAYLHLSTATIFSGEYLYYKFYNLNAATGRLSGISRVAYVSLIDPEGKEVFTQKLRLNKGMAYGDFFVNTDLLSGEYTLVGYTRWMQNGGIDQTFHQTVKIINPYNTKRAGILPDASDSLKTRVSFTLARENWPPFAPTEGGLIEMAMDTAVYGPRSPFNLQLRNFKGRLGHGSYSLTIKKVEELEGPAVMSALQYAVASAGLVPKLPKRVGDSVALPEQRGELIYGQVLQQGQPVSGQEVFLSVPGQQYVLKALDTDDAGNFYGYLRESYSNGQLIIQAPSNESLEIVYKSAPKLDFSDLTNEQIALKAGDREAIVARSVQNQLENAFFSVKPDSVPAPELEDPFLGALPEITNLDEYTRFRTLEETLVEILNLVGYRKTPTGRSYIRVAQDFETFDEEFNTDPALVLIDGVYIPDVDLIRNFDARLIKRIKVLRDPLVLGGLPYQGVVYFETFEGDFAENYQAPNALNTTLDLPQPQKLYFRQQHGVEGSEYESVPDFRNILLWEPELTIDGPELFLKGFTSDLTGTFEVVLEGFTTYGKPISVRTRFMVK